MKTLNFTTIGGETNKHPRKLLNQLSFLILSFFLISCPSPINQTPVNQPPIGNNQTIEACDQIGNDVTIGFVRAEDPENTALTYSILFNDNNLFEIDSRTGVLGLASNQSLDYTSSTQHTITVQVSDGDLTKDVNVIIDVLAVPSLVSEYIFTYNEQDSIIISNNGGEIQSHNLTSNNLPTGLKLTNRNGQLVIEGTPTRVTLDGAAISAVSLGIEASNKCGLDRASVDVTVNPIFVSGEQSLGIVHVVTDAAAAHTHGGTNGTNITHTHAGSAENSPLIHVASNISFASGGTGSVADPVLIGVKSDATSLSFVVDFNDVMIPNFNANNNDAFLIQLVGIPVGATITNIRLEYMEVLDVNNKIFFSFPPHITIGVPLDLVAGDPAGFTYTRTGRTVLTDPQIMGMRQQMNSVDVGTLESRFRITIDITPPPL